VGIVVGIATFSPVFALRTVQVDGTARLAAAEVAAALDDQLGRPIPLLDQDAIDRDLDAFPMIRSYVLESRLPDTLVVRVVERTPVGTVQTSSGFELVDASGVTVQTTDARAPGFPLIAVPSGAAVADRGAVGFTAAASVLAALPAELLSQVDSITATSVDDVTLELTAGERVVWGSAADSVTKAEHLTALLAQHPTTVTEYDVSSPGVGIIR
jgi:cell division protein FtsQ